MRHRLSRLVFVIAALFLTSCVDPAAQQAVRERQDARLKVLGDAVFYWRCAHQPIVNAAECQQWTEAYQRDLTTFVAKYGDGKN